MDDYPTEYRRKIGENPSNHGDLSALVGERSSVPLARLPTSGRVGLLVIGILGALATTVWVSGCGFDVRDPYDQAVGTGSAQREAEWAALNAIQFDAIQGDVDSDANRDSVGFVVEAAPEFDARTSITPPSGWQLTDEFNDPYGSGGPGRTYYFESPTAPNVGDIGLRTDLYCYLSVTTRERLSRVDGEVNCVRDF